MSSAMNTIVATRAGKDLISSLASGLLTIGSRFRGALDEAAAMFSNARDTGLTPREFVDNSRKANKLSKLKLNFFMYDYRRILIDCFKIQIS